MGRKFCKGSIVAAHILSVGLFACGDASALTYKEIQGSWCTGGGIEQFDQRSLTAIRSSDGVRTVFKIERYEYADKAVTIVWIDSSNKKVHTDFGEFSADGNSMVQLANKQGPRREFHRC